MNTLTLDLDKLNNLTESEREKLHSLVAKARGKYKCSGGEFYIGGANVIWGSSMNSSRRMGIEFSDEEEAKKALTMRTEREILNNIIRQERVRMEGLIPGSPRGCFTIFRSLHGSPPHEWVACRNPKWSDIGVEYCLEESANLIVEALNDGRVEGLT